jgi:hypothetical protein
LQTAHQYGINEMPAITRARFALDFGVLDVVLLTSIVTLFCLRQSQVFGQQLPVASPWRSGTGAISGVVLDGSSHLPLAGAAVTLVRLNQGLIGCHLTDALGRFVFTELPAGSYDVMVSQLGYVDGTYGPVTQPGGAGRQIILRDGDWFPDARVSLDRPGAITGSVTDEAGDPVVGAYVRALVEVVIGGRPHWSSGPVTKTDDRGSYRLGALAPGRYLVNVPTVQATITAGVSTQAGRPSSTSSESSLALEVTGAAGHIVLGAYPVPAPTAGGQPRVYATAYYPGASSFSEAQIVEVRRAEERSGVSLQLVPVTTVRVSGVVTGRPEALADLMLRVLAQDVGELGNGSEVATTSVRRDGTFLLLGVPAGRFTLEVSSRITEYQFKRPTLLGAVMNVLPASNMIPHPAGLGQAVPSNPPGAWVMAQGSLTSNAYWGSTPLDVGGHDISDVAIPLQRGVTISGRVVSENGSPSPVGAVVPTLSAEPTDGNIAHCATRDVRQDHDSSRFTISGLKPDSYFVRGNIAGSIRSVVWNGRDMTDLPFDASAGQDYSNVVVTLAEHPISLRGTVQDSSGRLTSESVVIAFPVDRAQWTDFGISPRHFSTTAVASDGTWHLSNPPAGDLWLVAVDEAHRGAWQDRSFLEAATAFATHVVLNWGDAKMVPLTLHTLR